MHAQLCVTVATKKANPRASHTKLLTTLAFTKVVQYWNQWVRMVKGSMVRALHIML